MTVFLVTFLIVCFCVFCVFCVFWIVNLSMTVNNTESYGWGTFGKFKEQYLKYKWEIKPSFKCFFIDYSRFDYSTNSKLHAGIVKFNGKGMLLDPISMVMASFWMISLQKENKKQKIKW